MQRRRLFFAASFVSSFALFLVEPLVGKRLLPVLGGSASVWVVATVVFQVLLLLGYVYAHLLSRLSVRAAAVLQMGCLGAGLATYPFAIAGPSFDRYPTLTTTLFLLRSVGLPFFALSANTPLLQRWYREKDAYQLYAMSNAGSFAALFVFPFVMEPFVGLHTVNTIFALSLALATLLVAASAFSKAGSFVSEPSSSSRAEIRISWRTRGEWVLLAGAPSLLLSAVNGFVVVDLGALPLLWVAPLGLYLLSFVLGFQERFSVRLFERVFPFVSLLAAALLLHRSLPGVFTTVGLLLFLLFSGALLCHRRLYLLRPEEARLTEFYLWVSIGGALGGLFSGTLAPVLFRHPVELWMGISLVLLVHRERELPHVATLLAPLLVAGVCGFAAMFGDFPAAITAAAAGLLLYSQREARPSLFALGIFAILSATTWIGGRSERFERNYFGTLRLLRKPKAVVLMHGSTVHGVGENPPVLVPHSYYSKKGPVGVALAAIQPACVPCNVGIVGLGAGSLLTYWGKQDRIHIFEIDPNVVTIAKEEFPFLPAAISTVADLKMVVGDARQTLRSIPEATFDVLFVDAFSSDAVPVHLLTREALGEFRRKLRSNGVMLFHISNRYFELEPYVAGAAASAGLTAAALQAPGDHRLDASSKWVWVSTREAPSGFVRTTHLATWTDDFSSSVHALKWRD